MAPFLLPLVLPLVFTASTTAAAFTLAFLLTPSYLILMALSAGFCYVPASSAVVTFPAALPLSNPVVAIVCRMPFPLLLPSALPSPTVWHTPPPP